MGKSAEGAPLGQGCQSESTKVSQERLSFGLSWQGRTVVEEDLVALITRIAVLYFISALGPTLFW